MLGMSVGSMYAWSLFYAPIEAALGVGRAWLSGAFSLASIAFAGTMLLGPLAFHGWRGAHLALLSGALAAAGMLVPALFPQLWIIVLAYGLIFGPACGLAYCVSMQTAVLAWPHRRGLAAGITAVSGAIGSVVAAAAFRPLIVAHGPWNTLLYAGIAVGGFGTVAAWLLRGTAMPRLDRIRAGRNAPGGPGRGWPIELRLWLGYFFGACAGLMALGHAAGIAGAYGGAGAPVALAAVLITGGNAVGRLGAGWMADRVPVRRLLALAPVLAAAALLSLALVPDIRLALVTLAATGLAYGMLAAGFPAAVAQYFGVERTGVVYGRVFTAWGAAGLLAPGLAGYLFDRTGGYVDALLLAAGAAMASSLSTFGLPRQQQTP